MVRSSEAVAGIFVNNGDHEKCGAGYEQNDINHGSFLTSERVTYPCLCSFLAKTFRYTAACRIAGVAVAWTPPSRPTNGTMRIAKASTNQTRTSSRRTTVIGTSNHRKIGRRP